MRLVAKFIVVFGAGIALLWACTGVMPEESSLEVGDTAFSRPLVFSYYGDFEAAFGVRGEPVKIADSRLVGEKIIELLNQEFTRRGLVDREELLSTAMHCLGAKVMPEGSGFSVSNNQWHFIEHDEVKDPKEKVAVAYITSVEEGSKRRLLREMPAEFQLYFRSINSYRDDAIQFCEQLLALPPEQRRNLSVLAAYRLGRLRLKNLLEDQGDLSEEELLTQLVLVQNNLERVFVLIKEGYPDWANFEKASEGWLAYTYGFIEEDFSKALKLYTKLHREGDVTAERSIMLLGEAMLMDVDDALTPEILAEKNLQRLVIFCLARGVKQLDYWVDARIPSPVLDKRRLHVWVKLLASQPNLEAYDYIRLATLQYREGLWSECAQTLKQCPGSDPTVKFLQTRLLFREGKISEATKIIQAQVQSRDTSEVLYPDYFLISTEDYDDENIISPYFCRDALSKQVLLPKFRSDYASLLLSQGKYEEALNLFLRTCSLADAVYIGECVLTLEEFQKLVDRDWPEFKREIKPEEECLEKEMTIIIRSALGRRLFRMGRWQESEVYFPEDLRPYIAQYRQWIQDAENQKNSPKVRADAYWRAALIMQRKGQSLMFCNFGIDWSGWSSPQEPPKLWWEVPGSLPRVRVQPVGDQPESLIAPPSADEVKRVEAWMAKNLDHPTRSHRDANYEVVRLGMLAAELLPVDDEGGAKILQYCGNLIKYREPKAAQPVYRLLATKFMGTSLGQRARKAHWFAPDRLEPNPDWVQKER